MSYVSLIELSIALLGFVQFLYPKKWHPGVTGVFVSVLVIKSKGLGLEIAFVVFFK